MTYEEIQDKHPGLFANPEGCPTRLVTDPAERSRVEAVVRERLERDGLPGEWAQTGIVHRDQYLVMLRDAVVFADGRPGTYLRLYEWPPEAVGVAVLPRLNGELVLVNHFRHATRSYHIEVPRGFATPGLSNEDNARKELAEEIGAECHALTPLGPLDSNTGLGGTRTELFFAEITRLGPPELAEGIVAILRVSTAQLEQMIGNGDISDAFTLACYVRARLAGLI